MIPILYETTEVAFTSNGLGRLRDCVSCVVTEERNGIYECDFEYPIDGAHFDLIRVCRIIGVTHDDSGDIQPFDIVSYSRPINGVVTFHCTHISYRQSYMTVTGSNINSLADAFTLLSTADPSNPFVYETDKTSTGYMAAADGIPKSVRQMLGGVEGSILDTYGGEYLFDRWRVVLNAARGKARDFSIRYGINMLNYDEDYDISGTYSSCIPYWTDGTTTVVGDRVDSGSATLTGRGECVPLDVSSKFEAEPTAAQVEAVALSMMESSQPMLPAQNIQVEFVRLQDMSEYEGLDTLLKCNLCDTINVVFPSYNATGRFKIVKTVWNVLKGTYDSMELGSLSMSLSEALGINSGSEPKSSQMALAGNYASNFFAATSSNPWTVQYSGILSFSSGTVNGQKAYIYVTDATDNVTVCVSTRLESANYRIGGCFPVLSGHQYYITSANLSSSDRYALLYKM